MLLLCLALSGRAQAADIMVPISSDHSITGAVSNHYRVTNNVTVTLNEVVMTRNQSQINEWHPMLELVGNITVHLVLNGANTMTNNTFGECIKVPSGSRLIIRAGAVMNGHQPSLTTSNTNPLGGYVSVGDNRTNAGEIIIESGTINIDKYGGGRGGNGNNGANGGEGSFNHGDGCKGTWCSTGGNGGRGGDARYGDPGGNGMDGGVLTVNNGIVTIGTLQGGQGGNGGNGGKGGNGGDDPGKTKCKDPCTDCSNLYIPGAGGHGGSAGKGGNGGAAPHLVVHNGRVTIGAIAAGTVGANGSPGAGGLSGKCSTWCSTKSTSNCNQGEDKGCNGNPTLTNGNPGNSAAGELKAGAVGNVVIDGGCVVLPASGYNAPTVSGGAPGVYRNTITLSPHPTAQGTYPVGNREVKCLKYGSTIYATSNCVTNASGVISGIWLPSSPTPERLEVTLYDNCGPHHKLNHVRTAGASAYTMDWGVKVTYKGCSGQGCASFADRVVPVPPCN